MRRDAMHEHGEGKGGWKDWLWMLICCLPMIVLIVLAVSGLWGFR